MSLRATMRRSWPVLLSYGLFSIWGVGCLFASLMLTSGGFGMSPGNIGVLFGVLGATVIGHVLGNLLGLAGLRLMPVIILFFLLFIGSTLSGVVLGAFALFLILALFAALGGYLGVASRLDVVAAWYPLSFAIGGAIHWMNHHGAVATFRGGAKHSLWDPFTMLCLTGAVFLMLTFLATRHALGLTVWQEVGRPRGGDPGAPVAVARPGRGSFLVLFLFTLVVLGSTALISPYLFRTRADDGKGPYKDGQGDPSAQGDGKPDPDGKGGSSGKGGKGSSGGDGTSEGSSGGGPSSGGHSSGGHSSGGHSSSGHSSSGHSSSGHSSSGQTASGSSSGQTASGSSSGSGASGEREGQGGQRNDGNPGQPIGKPDAEHAGNAAGEAMNLGLKVFLALLAAAAALLVFTLVFVPPLRRAFLMRHLQRPLWPVAPTARVMNLWRRALAVLAVLEIEPAPGETPRDFARRVETELRSTFGGGAPGLHEAAAIVEKIEYAGRGLGAGEEQAMREAVDAFVRAVDPHLGFRKKVAAAWGRPPEVES